MARFESVAEKKRKEMSHRYSRTDRDLRWLAVNFTAGKIVRALPERLECLAAYHRTVLEAEKMANGESNDYVGASEAYVAAIDRLRAAGVLPLEGDLSFSPCCGPDSVNPHTP